MKDVMLVRHAPGLSAHQLSQMSQKHSWAPGRILLTPLCSSEAYFVEASAGFSLQHVIDQYNMPLTQTCQHWVFCSTCHFCGSGQAGRSTRMVCTKCSQFRERKQNV